MAIACCGHLPAASAAAEDYIGVTIAFSPAKAQYYPGEDFSVNVTVVNLMPTPALPTDPLLNWVKALNVSASFSWMTPGDYVFTNVSGTSSWLPPDQGDSEMYAFGLSVPVYAAAQTYDYRVDVEYEVHTAWGNITYTWTDSHYGFVVSRTTQTMLTSEHEFSPAKASYAPGEDFTIEMTFTNALPTGVSTDDVFPCRITNVSVHFSWMDAEEYVWNDLSDEELWLSPDGTVSRTYYLNLTVPEDATETTQSYHFRVESVEAVPWGEESYTTDSWTYADFVVSESPGGVLGGVDGYVLYIAVAAIALSAVALGAVVHHRRESGRKAVALAVNGNGYPVLRPVPGEQFPLENGLIYLVKEKRPGMAFSMYNEAVSKGAEGMLISREHPNRLRELHTFVAKSIIWLSRRPGENHVDPTELSLVSLKISRFVEERKNSVVLIEGLEYLITQNDFEAVLRFVNHLHDFVLAHDCAIVVVVDPRVLTTRELALLERSARVVEPVEPAPEQPPQETKPAEA
jgi:hypothetical protein